MIGGGGDGWMLAQKRVFHEEDVQSCRSLPGTIQTKEPESNCSIC